MRSWLLSLFFFPPQRQKSLQKSPIIVIGQKCDSTVGWWWSALDKQSGEVPQGPFFQPPPTSSQLPRNHRRPGILSNISNIQDGEYIGMFWCKCLNIVSMLCINSDQGFFQSETSIAHLHWLKPAYNSLFYNEEFFGSFSVGLASAGIALRVFYSRQFWVQLKRMCSDWLPLHCIHLY